MRITCFYGSSPGMGYIYLNPPAVEQTVLESENELSKHIIPDQISIQYITDTPLAPFLDNMTVATNNFNADYEKNYDTEYGNDMDEQGYIIGIELTLDHEQFITLVKNHAFRIIQTEWRNKEFHLITFDHLVDVFKPENTIYRLTDEEDAFVIVQLVEPEKLGFHYSDEKDQKRPIALFKALISARDDIYPLEYLLKPEFILIENK
ncbi:hypothetical protein J2T13_005247 [Paenibacillus sp. DS2015]|uniref:hypothetical protein n=1 Tax=Paenibacillus sp. DS2015 TaxID=3373917 RepID=UPI003D1AE44F